MRYLMLGLLALWALSATPARAQLANWPRPGQYDAGSERASAQPRMVIVSVSYPAEPIMQLRAHTSRFALNCDGDSYWEWDISETWGDRHLFEASAAAWRPVRDRLCPRAASFPAYEGTLPAVW